MPCEIGSTSGRRRSATTGVAVASLTLSATGNDSNDGSLLTSYYLYIKIISTITMKNKIKNGFTLLEVLIVMTLLSIVFSYLIFNFSHSKDNSFLTEGSLEIKTLMIFSKSYAKNNGKTVCVIFPESQLGDEGENLKEKYPNCTVVVLVDDKPLEPAKYYLDIINNSVHVESSSDPQITFYPDGSVEKEVSMTVTSISEEDSREVNISVNDFSVKIKESVEKNLNAEF